MQYIEYKYQMRNGRKSRFCSICNFDADLRCSVPQRDHLVSVHTDRDTEGPGQTEISNLDASVLVNQEILGLHVSVENSPLVTEQDALQQLKPVKLIQLAISN